MFAFNQYLFFSSSSRLNLLNEWEGTLSHNTSLLSSNFTSGAVELKKVEIRVFGDFLRIFKIAYLGNGKL